MNVTMLSWTTCPAHMNSSVVVSMSEKFQVRSSPWLSEKRRMSSAVVVSAMFVIL